MQPPVKPFRKLACARCGAAFDCHLDGGCWCAAEPFLMPLPVTSGSDEDCLCPACLRKAALALLPPA